MNNYNYEALTVDEDVLKIVRKFFKDEEMGNPNARNEARLSLEEYLIKTDDGSYTLNSNKSHGDSEHMHTSFGGVSEALEKFVKPSKLVGKDEVHILDICSGLGYNAASCIEYLDDDIEIHLSLVEISKETLALSLLLDAPIKSYKIISKVVEDKLYREGAIKFKNYPEEIPKTIHISIKLDDARQAVKNFKGQEKFDAIFLDPFSPLKSPELYTYEFFLILKELLNVNGIILTYTSAAPVRSAMIKSGLYVGEGPSFGRSGGTVATLNQELIDIPISQDDERMIALSDAGIPFKDPNLNASSQTILQKRSLERESSRWRRKFPSTVKTPTYLNDELSNGRLKRRVLSNLKRMGFDDLKSNKSRYVVCPQYNSCICCKNCGNYISSREKIIEMEKRLKIVLNQDKNPDSVKI